MRFGQSTWLVSLALVGCYTDFRPGVTAPIGHGHGEVGLDIGLGLGGQYVGDRLRAGGGVSLGLHEADSGGYAPVGVEGRFDLAISDPDDRGGS